jgi:hypothetical protein
MYFTVTEHYVDFPEDDPPELNECLICLEIYAPDNVKPIDLKTQQIYLKKCEWHDVSNSCPICRLHMTKYGSMISIFSLNFVNYASKCIFGFIRICCIFWFLSALSCSYHIYKSYFILKPRSYIDKCEYITE